MWGERARDRRPRRVLGLLGPVRSRRFDDWEHVFNSKTLRQWTSTRCSRSRSTPRTATARRRRPTRTATRPAASRASSGSASCAAVRRGQVDVPQITTFVDRARWATRFVEPPPFNLTACYDDSSCADAARLRPHDRAPTRCPSCSRSRRTSGFGKKLKAISLGQGQGDIAAQRMIQEAQDKGTWVCLQNCHLCVSWMPDARAHLRGALAAQGRRQLPPLAHVRCRAPAFPAFVLQNGVKMTNEPPKGMRANLAGSYHTLDHVEARLVHASRSSSSKLLFGLCFFHATARERMKFGPLGWNVRYAFNETDLDISCVQLEHATLEPYDDIPYTVLAAAHVGRQLRRARDGRHRPAHASTIILNELLHPGDRERRLQVLELGHVLPIRPTRTSRTSRTRTTSRRCRSPRGPEVFGMHDNANITCAIAETQPAARHGALAPAARRRAARRTSFEQVDRRARDRHRGAHAARSTTSRRRCSMHSPTRTTSR